MAIPPGVTTCLVYKKAPVSFGGSSAKVHLEITPSVRLVHTATGTPLADFVELVAPARGPSRSCSCPTATSQAFRTRRATPSRTGRTRPRSSTRRAACSSTSRRSPSSSPKGRRRWTCP
jgi:hypothetical protein